LSFLVCINFLLNFQIVESAVTGYFEDGRNEIGTNMGEVTRPSILGAAILYRIGRGVSSDDEESIDMSSSEEFDRSWPRARGRSTMHSHHVLHTRRVFDMEPEADSARNDMMQTLGAFNRTIPPSVDATKTMRDDHFRYIITTCKPRYSIVVFVCNLLYIYTIVAP
jgi:hypothetical protein